MRRSIYLPDFDQDGWPASRELEAYFLTRAGQRRAFEIGNDCWGLSVEGVDGTAHMKEYKGRIDINLTIIGSPRHGVLLCHQKWGGRYKDNYYSKGDLSRLLKWTRTNHGDVMSIGLFIPFEEAWKAIKEFMAQDGALPSGIAWVSNKNIPQEAFPDPVRGIPTE